MRLFALILSIFIVAISLQAQDGPPDGSEMPMSEEEMEKKLIKRLDRAGLPLSGKKILDLPSEMTYKNGGIKFSAKIGKIKGGDEKKKKKLIKKYEKKKRIPFKITASAEQVMLEKEPKPFSKGKVTIYVLDKEGRRVINKTISIKKLAPNTSGGFQTDLPKGDYFIILIYEVSKHKKLGTSMDMLLDTPAQMIQ